MRALVLIAIAPAVRGHGTLLRPVSRAVHLSKNFSAGACSHHSCEWYSQATVIPGKTTNCDRQMRTMGAGCDGGAAAPDFPCPPGAAVPWCAPGTAPVVSPCGVFSGGWPAGVSRGRDMRDLEPAPGAQWPSGGLVNVSIAIVANHGGGWVFRLCPAASDLSEACFQNGTLPYEGTTQWLTDDAGSVLHSFPAVRTSQGTTPSGSLWARNPVPMFPQAIAKPFAPVEGRGPFRFRVTDQLRLPSLPAGAYVLSWRWDAEQTKQVWSQCGDVTIVESAEAEETATDDAQQLVHFPVVPLVPPAPQAAPAHDERRRTTKHVCTGGSLGLDVVDCDSWVALYDALGGPGWPVGQLGSCPSIRTDPCGCNSGVWGYFLRCNGKRDVLHITEIYLLGPDVRGQLPAEIGDFNALVALSIVESSLIGTLPEELGHLPALEMLWLDNNHHLGGAVPPSMIKLGERLSVIELSRSNFSGPLPALPWAAIPDCTLDGLTFECPLPAGAGTSCGARCL